MKWETEQTNEKIKKSQNGDSASREWLMKENAPLVKAIVKRYLGRGADYDDLFQVGNMGLLKAISGFDDKFNVRFSTYAVPMISGEVKRYIRDNNTVKMPRSLKELQQKIRFSRQTLSIKNGKEPSANQIAENISVPLEDVLFALESMNNCISLDEPLGTDSESTIKDVIEDKGQKVSVTDSLALKQCIDQLEERERKIIYLRYYKNLTQTKVAGIMGISQVQISRIESRTIEKLRKKLA